LKLPVSTLEDLAFNLFMTQHYARLGCPFFSQHHAEQVVKLSEMKAKVYLLKQELISNIKKTNERLFY